MFYNYWYEIPRQYIGVWSTLTLEILKRICSNKCIESISLCSFLHRKPAVLIKGASQGKASWNYSIKSDNQIYCPGTNHLLEVRIFCNKSLYVF